VIRQFFKNPVKAFIGLLWASIFFLYPISSGAMLEVYEINEGLKAKRSIESLRDLDSQSWQLVVYPHSENNGQLILRIIGFKGSLRIDHPTKLEIYSGIKSWDLEDITVNNPLLKNDDKDAFAEFPLENLLNDLNSNRPLRLVLKGGFTDLPVPPYVVQEWRSINSMPFKDGK